MAGLKGRLELVAVAVRGDKCKCVGVREAEFYHPSHKNR